MRKSGIDKRLGNVLIKQSGTMVSEEDTIRLIYESIFSMAQIKETDLKKSKRSRILDISCKSEEAL